MLSMGLRDIESTLPPGFRFYPSDEELICHYLYKKVMNERASEVTMVEVDLHISEPWELPDVAKLSAKEWYFFSFRDRKYATGCRANRATKSGYWKATGKDRVVSDPISQATVGMRKTLVFYQGRAPNGIKTGWVMHEFRLENPHMPLKEDWVLCRVFQKREEQPAKCDLEVAQNKAGNPSPNYLEPSSSSPLMDTMNTDVFKHQLQRPQLDAHYQRYPSHSHQLDAAAASCHDGSFINLLSVWRCDVAGVPIEVYGSSCGDAGGEYGFLMDMEELAPGYGLGDHLRLSGLGGMRFRDAEDKVFF